MTTVARRIRQCWPDSLFGRLALVWLFSQLAGHLIGVAASFARADALQSEKSAYYLSKDLSHYLPLLDAAGPVERQALLKKMERQDYQYELAPDVPPAVALLSPFQEKIASNIGKEMGQHYAVTASVAGTTQELLRLHLSLKDGTPLRILLLKTNSPLSPWGGVLFVLQALPIILFTWLAVRQATRPLARLAEAAEVLGSSLHCEPIAEQGPSEVARAAAAFNAMQRKIAEHLAERVQILAAISHDLQTPITRMRLRADLMDNDILRDKLQSDLSAMQMLVEEGIAYARSAQHSAEEMCRVDVDALLDSLVCDYVDGAHNVTLQGAVGRILSTRPNTLKRIIINLVDNALKFADGVGTGGVRILVAQPSPGLISISVLDCGPGIAESELNAVLKPFYRVENSRNRSTGGTGLGLAIAQQLSKSLQGSLSLKNREGGGLEATVVIPGGLASKNTLD